MSEKRSPAMRNQNPIVFCVALGLEASAFLEFLPFQKQKMHGFSLYRCSSRPFFLVRTGMGNSFPAGALQALLRELSPRWVINVGFCGSLHREISPGQALLIERAFLFTQSCIPVQSEPLDSLAPLAPGLDWPTSPICTVQKPVTRQPERQALLTAGCGPVVDMECFHLARLVHELARPFSAIKVVSDFADQETAHIFRHRKPELKNQLRDSVQKLLAHLPSQ